MATEFICTVGASGCDFTDPATWEGAMDDNYHSVGGGNFASARYRVYSFNSLSGTVGQASVVVGQTNNYTATCVWRTSSQICVVHDTDGETFGNGEVLQVSAGNSVTTTNTGDTVIPVLEVSGTVSYSSTFSYSGWTLSETNKSIIRAIGGAHRTAGALRYGTAAGILSYTGSGHALTIIEEYVDVEDIDIQRTDGTNNTFVVSLAQSGASNSVNFRRCVLKCTNGGTGSRCVNVGTSLSNLVGRFDACLLYSVVGTRVVNNSSGTLTFNNCTLYNGAGGTTGVTTGAGTINAVNSYAASSGSGTCWAATTLNLNHCASADTTGTLTTAHDMRSKAAADQFTAVATDGTEDFRPKVGAYILDLGVDVSGLTEDIFGTAISSGSVELGAAMYAASNDTHTCDGGVTLGAITVGSGTATHGMHASGGVSLGAVTIAGSAERVVTASGGTMLGSIDVDGVGHPTYSGSGAVTLGAVTIAGSAKRVVTATGGATLGAMTVSGGILAAPSALYCNNGADTAQSGQTNPTGITDLTPNFSAKVSKLSANITHVAIQVSAIDDSDFSETLSWDSGWLELVTPITHTDTDGTHRTEDITYGQGA